MFGAPVDAWYVWIGLAVVASTTVGVASALPAAQPPDASSAARTVDGVAASEYEAVGKHPLPGIDSIRLGADSISVRGAGGTDHAAFGYDSVTPVTGEFGLEPVLHGEPPDRAFESRAAFERAIERARAAEPEWRQTDRLLVRRVSWGDIDAVVAG
jgi:hypothetical protein